MASKLNLLTVALFAFASIALALNPVRDLETTEGIPSDVTFDQWTWSSSADAQFITVCMDLYQEDYYFCNVANENSRTNNTYGGYGWCCPTNTTGFYKDPHCIETTAVSCTNGNKEKQGEPLYLSYWPGMTDEICGRTSESLVASTEA